MPRDWTEVDKLLKAVTGPADDQSPAERWREGPRPRPFPVAARGDGRELPLRFIDQPGGPVIRCLCGAEAAQLRRGTVNSSMVGLRASGPPRTQAGSDITAAAVLMMVTHALACQKVLASHG